MRTISYIFALLLTVAGGGLVVMGWVVDDAMLVATGTLDMAIGGIICCMNQIEEIRNKIK